MAELTKLIDRAIGALVREKGEYTYEDVESRVSAALGPNLEPTLVELGKQKLRDRILARARDISHKLLDESLNVHPMLFEDGLAPIYPCRVKGGTVFKPLVKMHQFEIAQVIDSLGGDQAGIGRHIAALRALQARLSPIWGDHPDFTVERAQSQLAANAAE